MNYDIVPSSVNTFFNPLIELPFYFLTEYFNNFPVVVYGFQGIFFGLLLFFFFKIALLFFDYKTVQGKIQILLACLIAATGQMTWVQTGSTTNEITVSIFVLAVLYLLLKMCILPHTQKIKTYFWCGLLLGTALGLKSTVITYCIASGITLIICFKYLKQPFKSISAYALGGLAGFLLINGYFMYQFYLLYHNPFFPFLNGIFQSPYFDLFNYSDRRFIPPFQDMFFFPFTWFLSRHVSEVNLEDLRFPLLYGIFLLFLGFIFKERKIKDFYLHKQKWTFLIIFMFTSYLFWLFTFCILRYAVPIEMLSAVVFVFIAFYIRPKTPIRQIIYYTFCVTALGIFLTTLLPETSYWGKNTSKHVIEVEDIYIPSNTLLKLYSFPTAGVIPVWAKKYQFRALGYMHLNGVYMSGSDFVERGKFREMRDQIEQNHTGPVIIIYRTNPDIKLQNIIDNSMDLTDKFCRKLKTNLDQNLYICVPNHLKDQILNPQGEKNE